LIGAAMHAYMRAAQAWRQLDELPQNRFDCPPHLLA